MLYRQASVVLQSLARTFPAVVVTGPRQSGKTTLVRQVFPDRPYINLEDPDRRAVVEADPRGFLMSVAGGAILDEVQRVPSLLSYLQTQLDASSLKGRFILTGSQQFGLMDGVTQSLAGRVGLLTLLPLSQAELDPVGMAASLDQRLWKGAYPALHAQTVETPDPLLWYSAYVATYLERDVRALINVGNLMTFQRFVAMCAARSGQMLNLNSLATDLGISQPTARQWLTVLQASHLVMLLAPYHRNFGKRLVKSPKLYFLDTGLLCYLLQIRAHDELYAHPMRGAIFETWVVAETLKHRFHQGLPADITFWRDHHGLEVDLVFEHAGRLHGVEIKSGATFVPEWLDPSQRWQRLVGDEAEPPMVLYGGDEDFLFKGRRVISWRRLGLA